MKLDFGSLHVYFHHVADPRIDSVLAALSQLKQQAQTQGAAMSAQLDRIRREVAESRTVTESAVTLIGGLAQQIRDLKDDPAALEALADDLDAQQNQLGKAVTDNTPSAPNP